MEFKKCSIAGKIFEESHFDDMIQIMRTNQSHATYIREFLTLISVCHTVVPEVSVNDKSKRGKMTVRYQAASPDEGALVCGAQKIGFEFITRTPRYVFINALAKEERYQFSNIIWVLLNECICR